MILEVCLDGVVQTEEFDPIEECIDAVMEAMLLKEQNPHGVVTILVSVPTFSRPNVETGELVELFCCEANYSPPAAA